jgi:alkylation response protein AidB-like acyl-CoA dehydrogenase
MTIPVSANSPALTTLFDAIAEGAAQRDHDRVLPFEQIDLIRRARLGALRVPAEDGGGGATHREAFEVVIRLAEADANVAHILRNHFSFVEIYTREPGVPQVSAWRKLLADGAIIGLASAELESAQVGAVKLATTITPAPGGGYRLNGIKYYSTGTIFSDYVLVRATGPEDRGVSLLIPVKREGIEIIDDWDGMGQRLTGTGTTRFADVAVAEDEVVFDTPGIAYGRPYYNTQAQLYLTAIVAGIIRATLRDAVALVKRRGRTYYYAPAPRAVDDPILQQVVGQIAANAFAAETVVLAAADALERASLARERGEPSEALDAEAAMRASQAKIVADELAIKSGGLLFDVGGASATKRETNLDRHWRNARTLASHNPASYKAQVIGALEINGTPLPAKGFF